MISRRDTTSFVGLAIFLGGWSMTFLALVFVWADVRLSAGAWPPDGEPRAPLLFPSLATAIIVGSSWALARGRARLTAWLGGAFIVVQACGWIALWRSGVTPSSGRYGSLVYTFAAFHALHVVVGLAGLVAARARRNWRIFWHFVGAAWIVLFALLYLAGCSDEHPFRQPLVLGGRTVDAATLNRGRDAYQQYCRPCHGERGDGRGHSAPGLRPPPRDLRQALFKFGRVTEGLPPDEELARIVRLGLNGTAMRPWDVPDVELDPVLQYIKTFSPRWRSERPSPPVALAPDPWPARVADAVARGDKVFHETAQCAKCHEGERELKSTDYCLDDECERPVKELPPDLRCDPLRTVHAGSELVDLARTIASGIGGASMPPWKGGLPDEDIWSLAYYVRSIRQTGRQTGCSSSRTGQ